MEASGPKSAKKIGGTASGPTNNPNLRVTPKTTTPSLRSKPPGSSSTTKKRATTTSSTGSGSGAGASIKLKQNMFPVNKNPGAMKIKGSTGVNAAVGAGRPPLPTLPSALNFTSNNSGDSSVLTRTTRAAPEAQNPTYDVDEEILDSLYTRYLQLRLLAQIATKKRRKAHSILANTLTNTHIEHALDRKCFEVQYLSLMKIQKQVEQLEKIEDLEKDIDPLVVKVCADAVQPSFEQFEQKLSEKLDIIPFPNKELETLDYEPLLELNAQLESVWNTDDDANPLNFMAGSMKNREELQQICNEAVSEEKEMNEQITKLISLKISKADAGEL